MQAYLDSWMRHIEALAQEIGPRGSTRESERRAAEYAAKVMQGLGLSPALEPFRSATSLFLLQAMVAGCFLLAFAIYPLAGRLSAGISLLICLAMLASQVLELLFQPHPLRALLPRGDSQNVVTVLPPQGEHQRDLILIGHLDTNHSPLTFRSPQWVDFLRVWTSLTFFGYILMILFYAIGFFTGAAWVWPVVAPGALVTLVFLLICLEAEFAPFSPGANDNASGAGLVLSLAEHLLAEPLRHTRMWFVNTGCEEVKHYGAIDFFERHKAEFRNPAAVVFEMLGVDGPAWLLREGMIQVFMVKADPDLAELCARVALANPELGGHPTQVSGGHSEMADALRFGVPAITLIGIDAGGTRFNYDGPEVYWHRIDDTPDKLNPLAMAHNYAFTWALIRSIDAGQPLALGG